MRLPSAAGIEALHHQYAPHPAVFQLVYVHSQIVAGLARQLIDVSQLPVDRQLIEVGCLLHDIGAYRLYTGTGLEHTEQPYVSHGARGEEILRAEGFPEVIWRFASHHTGVGLSAAEIAARHLPMPIEDFFADTREERLIMYADKFHSKSTPPTFNSYAWYRDHLGQFGTGKQRAFDALAAEFGQPDLNPLITRYGHRFRDLA